MKDLKIKPGMDTPKAKLKNPAPKDANSILKKHMDKRQREKEPESRDPVRYATDRVEKNMRRGASGAADASRRMIKHYRGKLRQSKENVVGSHSAADMAIGSESVFIDTPMEYAFSPVETAARNEVGNRTISPQTRGGTKSANAAPQERGRQKVIQDAKAAYRRNLAEKRTTERRTSAAPKGSGRTAADPFQISEAAKQQGSPPKIGGIPRKEGVHAPKSRAFRQAQPAQSVMQKAKSAAQRRMQRKMLQKSAQSGGKTAKKLSGTATQAAKVIGKSVASAASSILTAGGGAVVLVLLLTVILVAAIVASPFGILFSNESREAGVVPLSAAVAQVNYDFNERLEALQTADDYDSISVTGQPADWIEVLAVFAVKVAGSNDADAADVATMDADRIARLKAVFWDMTAIKTEVETINHPGSGDDGWTERNLYITITAKTAEEMKTEYHFNRNQIAALDELLELPGFMGFQTNNEIATGLGFGARKGNSVVQALLRDYDALDFLKADGSADLTPCPERNTRVLQALGVRKDGTRQSIAEMEIFPAEYFCPMDLYSRELRVTPKTYSIHRYAESWKPKPSAVSRILQRLLKKHYYTWYCPLRGRIEGRLRKRT